MSRPTAARALRELLASGTHAVPGAFNAAVGMIAERCGFPAVYVSGAGTSNGVAGVPDIGLLSLEEMVRQARYTAEAVSIPTIADADTGFGGPLNVRRTVQQFEAAGIAGIHLEDQEHPKRCGHLEGKRLIPTDEMRRKVRAATEARANPDFVVIARTDARSVEGLQAAISRASQYVEAGADAVFPEGLTSAEEFAEFAAEIPVPLMANMTEFGKTPYLSVEEFAALGYRFVLFPMTAFRIAMRAVESALSQIAAAGTQQSLESQMQTRAELYDLLRYADYAHLDKDIAGY